MLCILLDGIYRHTDTTYLCYQHYFTWLCSTRKQGVSYANHRLTITCSFPVSVTLAFPVSVTLPIPFSLAVPVSITLPNSFAHTVSDALADGNTHTHSNRYANSGNRDRQQYE